MECSLHLSGRAEEGRIYIQSCSSQVGAPAFYVCVSPCTTVSCLCLTLITYASNRPYSQSFYVCCHIGSFFPLLGLSTTSFTLVFGPEKRAGNLLNASAYT